jgi:hypothetical protein
MGGRKNRVWRVQLRRQGRALVQCERGHQGVKIESRGVGRQHLGGRCWSGVSRGQPAAETDLTADIGGLGPELCGLPILVDLLPRLGILPAAEPVFAPEVRCGGQKGGRVVDSDQRRWDHPCPRTGRTLRCSVGCSAPRS